MPSSQAQVTGFPLAEAKKEEMSAQETDYEGAWGARRPAGKWHVGCTAQHHEETLWISVDSMMGLNESDSQVATASRRSIYFYLSIFMLGEYELPLSESVLI